MRGACSWKTLPPHPPVVSAGSIYTTWKLIHKMHVKLGVHVRLFLFLVWTIPHIRYTKILTWLRDFLVIFLLVWFPLCSSWSLLGIARQWSLKETLILTLKPRIHVRIFNKSNVGYWTAVSAFFPWKLLLNISRISFSRREKENQYKSI